MKKFNPEMKVVRFGNEDVIVTSGVATKTMAWSQFGDGTANNGIVNYNGVNYTIDSDTAITNLFTAMGVSKYTGIQQRNGVVNSSINTVLGNELKNNGVSSPGWNTTYLYDSDATWNNGSKDIKGVFYRQ